jgi:hypothetical protein
MHTDFLRTVLLAIGVASLTGCGGGGGGGGGTNSAPSGTDNGTGSGSGSLLPPPTATGNSLPIVLDAGPKGNALNIPFVSVTVCPPGSAGTSAACQTIDHVAIDTGATGLRLVKSALSSALKLPAVTDSSGKGIGECAQFADGFTWGSVRLADIYLGGKVARNVPFQDIGDTPGAVTAIPTTNCSNTGVNESTVATLGANGLLGVGLFVDDSGIYYACSGNTCGNPVSPSSGQVVQNPVALFAGDNNGVVIDLPTVGPGGATALSGLLIFGIGTQSNNGLGTATVYATDPSGDYTTTLGTSTVTSFIDSGSNGLFFNTSDPAFTNCGTSHGFYCPASPQTRTATNTAYLASSGTAVSFTVESVDALLNGIVAANVGGPSGSGLSGRFDWGLPFFFGRKVFTGIQGKSVPGGGPTGPFWAY